jgi:hypothetical protein
VSEPRAKPINTICAQNVKLVIIEAGCKYSNHWAIEATNRALVWSADCISRQSHFNQSESHTAYEAVTDLKIHQVCLIYVYV